MSLGGTSSIPHGAGPAPAREAPLKMLCLSMKTALVAGRRCSPRTGRTPFVANQGCFALSDCPKAKGAAAAPGEGGAAKSCSLAPLPQPFVKG